MKNKKEKTSFETQASSVKQKKQNKPYRAAQDQLAQTSGHLGTIFLATAAALFILIGSVMLFVDGIEERYLIYLMSAVLIALGIGLIVKYFVTEAYRSMHDYSFSGGALVVILGGSALARTSQLVTQISGFVGLLVLAVAVVMLQQALQLHIMRKPVWPVVLTVACVTLLAAVVLLFDLHVITDNIEGIAYWVLLLAGILTLVCMLISGIGVKRFLHQEHEEQLRKQKEQQQAFTRAFEKKQMEQQMKKIELQECEQKSNQQEQAEQEQGNPQPMPSDQEQTKPMSSV